MKFCTLLVLDVFNADVDVVVGSGNKEQDVEFTLRGRFVFINYHLWSPD